MKTKLYGKQYEIEIGQRVFIGRNVSIGSTIGEYAVLKRTSKIHLVFETEITKQIVKCDINNLNNIVGKAFKRKYSIYININRKDIKFIENSIIL